MRDAGLAAYFLAAYSTGLVSLAVSLASWLRRRSAAARDFFLASLALAIVVAGTIALNSIGAPRAPRLVAALHILNHAGAALCAALLPLLVHSAYRVPRSKEWNAGFAALACAAAIAAAALAFAGLPSLGSGILLGAKDLALLYTLIRAFANRSRRHDGELENVLYFASIGTAIVFPLILASEFAPFLIAALLGAETKGAIALPLVYSMLSLFYIVSWFKGYVRPPEDAEAAYAGFSARHALSPRETEVLRLLLGGQSYKEIMSSLSISMPTVKSHVVSIYRKTDCNNKMQLSLLFSSSPHPKG